MCVILHVCVCTYQRSSNIPLRPPPFTNTCIILSGRKGPVSYSFLSSDTSQASEGVAEGLMMPLLKARARLHGMTGPANYLIPSSPCDITGQCLLLQISLSTRCPQRVPHIFCFFSSHPSIVCEMLLFLTSAASQRSLGERQGVRPVFFYSFSLVLCRHCLIKVITHLKWSFLL